MGLQRRSFKNGKCSRIAQHRLENHRSRFHDCSKCFVPPEKHFSLYLRLQEYEASYNDKPLDYCIGSKRFGGRFFCHAYCNWSAYLKLMALISDSVSQLHAIFSLFEVYVSPVTMGLTVINRYARICKSDQQYRLFFSKRKSRILLGCAWMFVLLYILILRFAGLQEAYFVLGYAACLHKQLSRFGKMFHYFVVVGLFFILLLAATLFSYSKVLKKIREHKMGAVQGLCTGARNAAVSANEIRVSRSLFVVVFAFMLCWLPAWVITISTRFRIGGKMPRNVHRAFCLNLSNTINPLVCWNKSSIQKRILKNTSLQFWRKNRGK